MIPSTQRIKMDNSANDGAQAESSNGHGDSAAASASSTSAPAASPAMGDRPRLHISSLPASWTKDDAREYFQQFGTLKDVLVIRDSGSGRARYGFIEYESSEQAHSAMLATDGQKVQDATLAVKIAQPKATPSKPASESNSRLFCGHLGKGTTKDQIQEEFSKFGKVTDVSVFNNVRQARRPGDEALAAFVQFESRADAQAARDAMNGKMLLRGNEQELAEKDSSFIATPGLIVDFARSV